MLHLTWLFYPLNKVKIKQTLSPEFKLNEVRHLFQTIGIVGIGEFPYQPQLFMNYSLI